MIFNVAPRSRTVVDVMDEVRQLILPMTCSYLSSECLQEGVFVMLVNYYTQILDLAGSLICA